MIKYLGYDKVEYLADAPEYDAARIGAVATA